MKDCLKDLKILKMENENEEKVFFSPGQLVKLKQNIPNSPIMLVYKIDRSIIRNSNGKDYLKGCRTRWFTKDGHLQEAVFSTKDLVLVNGNE